MKSVCVFCGSSPGVNPAYIEAGRKVGDLLARRGITVVYGGGRIGVMGAVADAALMAGGKVTGVIPRSLFTREVAHFDLTDLRVVDSMHERKALMSDLSDGFLALPGGLGTLEELFEVATWAQLGIHSKPVAVLNVAGYFDRLLEFLDFSLEQGFIPARNRDLILRDDDPAELLNRMEAYRPIVRERWLTDRQR